MTDFVRRLVSGNKARFKDDNLDVELDLVYVTDNVVIMGYPASGLEGLYRNRREDAKRFLEHRHGKNFWVFNFCPVKENSYPASFFDGRVSRYPFPDHHAPPLALLPLAAREMGVWLSGSPERVVVLHCKAGKGRSGTLACSYLLTQDDTPSAPTLERSHPTKHWAKERARTLMAAMPEDDAPPGEARDLDAAEIISEAANPSEAPSPTAKPTELSPAPDSRPLATSFGTSLKGVLDLHTSRRMKAPSDASKTAKQGVSIPSQRRWLYYWSQLLAAQGPPKFWTVPPLPVAERPKVRLTYIKLRMKETSGMKLRLVKAANMVIDRTNLGKAGVRHTEGDGHVWVSLARYDDEFVDMLEGWERHTRDEHMGKRKKGSEHRDAEELSDVFADDKWDGSKMVRSFARLGAVGDASVQKEASEKDGKIMQYTLRPLSDEKWDSFKEEIEEDKPAREGADTDGGGVPSETNSIRDVTLPVTSEGVVLDAGREVRVKLYMGQVFMGWLWFIPTFHMPHPPPESPSSTPTKLQLTRKDVDFPIGLGSGIIDIEIAMEWCPEANAVQPPARQSSEELNVEGSAEPGGGLAATLQAVAAGAGTETVGDAVHTKQAAQD
ncbi:hypothetical protein PLICRDRAFT_156068 [Plicaturopsis crispa FD-325 SS-3]|nr:hypothetical protein PLICRDRAFT_156068 [Plicaturopsis crispa FD-325 SS-3]